MKRIIVTGASKGLGLQIVRDLAAVGYTVIGISRSVTPELKGLAKKYNGRIRPISFDLNNTADIPELFKIGIGFTTPIHGLVNNAAMAYDDIVTNAALEKLQEMFNINVYSPIFFTKYAIRHMLLHKVKGSIVHIASVCAHTGFKGLSMYGATKGALEAFSKNVSREWGSVGIRSNCVVPGFMETDMSSALTNEQKDRIYARTSLKRSTSLLSVSKCVIHLLSDEADCITGQNFVVDSGTI